MEPVVLLLEDDTFPASDDCQNVWIGVAQGRNSTFKLIKSRLRLATDFSTADAESVRYNIELAKTMEHEPTYRDPWHDDETQAIFLAEMAQSGFGAPSAADAMTMAKPTAGGGKNIFTHLKKRIFGS